VSASVIKPDNAVLWEVIIVRLASWRLVRELLEMCDVALEVVDIRDPISTRSRKLEALASNKGVPVVVVLNKADLIPLRVSESWRRYFEEYEGVRAVYISARKRLGTRILRKTVKDVVRDKSPLTVGVFGIPKVGKSTLINTLKGRHSASTSPYPGTPGYTRKSQLFKIGGNIYMIDTPGLVSPDGKDVESIIRSRPVDKLDNPVAVALKLINKVLKYNPYAFLQAYGIESRVPGEILAELARKRGWVYRKDGEPILHEAAKAVIRDYLDGKIVFYITPQQLEGSRSDSA